MTNPAGKPQPIAYYSSNLFEVGIGQVVISRFKASGAAEMGVFLVDVFCLGVKNGFFVKCDSGEHEERLGQIFQDNPPVELSAACGRKMVEGAVAYAAKFVLPAHRDYKLAARVLGGIDASDCDAEFNFGKDGKPFYVQGPNDSAVFAARVMDKLTKHCGEGEVDFICSVGD